MSHSNSAIRQCTSSECRFRFPSTDQQSGDFACPHCGAPTEQVALFSRRNSRVTGMPRGEPILELEALLDNIRSAYNVGSMFRTADGAGIRHLHLCGVTSFPSKHIAAHRRISKTALGAEQHLPWTYYRNGLDAVISLKRRGYRIWGIEENAEAQSVFELEPVPSETPIVLVMGNELVGIDPGVLEQCDRVLSIPMRGWKESLNVAVAFGVIAYVLRMVYAVNDVQANQR